VQLYLRRVVSSVTTRVAELKAFDRVGVAAGEVADFSLEVDVGEELKVFGRNYEWIQETGDIDIFVGDSYEKAYGDEGLQGKVTIVD